MVRSLLFLLFTIFFNNRLVAQHSTAVNNSSSEKKSPAPSPAVTGFKKQSSTTSSRQKGQAVSNSKVVFSKQAVGSGDAESASRASAIVTTDYAGMPADVQLKINNNKAQGKNLLTGIAKGFTVEIKACVTNSDRERTLSFLKAKKGFINAEFVSAGLVKIIVEPAFDSVDLKDAMNAEGIGFNFLNRFYLLKK